MSRFTTWTAVVIAVGLSSTFAYRQSAQFNQDSTRWEPTPRSPLYSGDPVKPRKDWFFYQRAYPMDRLPADARVNALKEAALIPEYPRPVSVDPVTKATATSQWTLMGPTGFDSDVEPTWGRMSGRVRALAIDPNNSNRLFLGTATGGVWRSTNGGTSWTPLTDAEESLAIGAIAIDPQDSNTIYVGTGEGNGTYYGVGILKSTNGGDSWTKLAEGTLGRGAIAGLLVSPTDSSVVACAMFAGLLLSDGSADPTGAVGGVYRSTDGGSTFNLTSSSFCRGIVAVPNDFNTQYYSATGLDAADNGLYKSTDAGQTWGQVPGTVNDPGRLAIGVSQDGSKVYIGGAQGDDVVTQQSTDGGLNWSAEQRTAVDQDLPQTAATAGQYCESQCFYDNVIAVNPFDDDNVFYGGVGIYQTTDGAQSFTITGSNNSGGRQLHVDHHMFVFDPNNIGTAYNGNDGGVYKTTDGGTTWTSIGGALATIQHYNLALHPTNAGIFVAGNQDNGTTRRTNSNVWTEVFGGDGGFSAIDHANPQTVFASTVELNLNRSDSNGDVNTYQDVTPPLDDTDTPNFIAPVVMDPLNSSILYAGSNRMWRTTDSGDTWNASGGDLTGGGGNITNIAIALSNNAVVYATTSNGMVQRSGNSGSTFNDTTAAPLPGRYATSVAVDPTDEDTAYVTYSGFNEATPGAPGHVFKTTNGGTSWVDISGNLPNIPFSAIEVRPDASQEIYAGSDVGMYISLNGGATWQKFSNGLPNAGVADIAVNVTTNLLAVATHGRSTWVTSLNGGGGNTNRAPTPQNDGATVTKGGSTTTVNGGQISLLANDTDPDVGDTLTANSTPVTPPTNGIVMINANGTFTYTHNDSMTTTDSFVYQVCDDGTPSLCANGTVNIVVQPPAGD